MKCIVKRYLQMIGWQYVSYYRTKFPPNKVNVDLKAMQLGHRAVTLINDCGQAVLSERHVRSKQPNYKNKSE